MSNFKGKLHHVSGGLWKSCGHEHFQYQLVVVSTIDGPRSLLHATVVKRIHYVPYILAIENKLSQPLVKPRFEAAGGRIFEWKLAVRNYTPLQFPRKGWVYFCEDIRYKKIMNIDEQTVYRNASLPWNSFLQTNSMPCFNLPFLTDYTFDKALPLLFGYMPCKTIIVYYCGHSFLVKCEMIIKTTTQCRSTCFNPWRSFINHHTYLFPLNCSVTLLINVWKFNLFIVHLFCNITLQRKLITSFFYI